MRLSIDPDEHLVQVPAPLRKRPMMKASPAIFSFAEDFSQSENLAGKEPQRLAEMKELFLAEAKENKVFPIGAGIWLRIGVVTLSQTEWNLPTIANVDARDFSDLAC